MKAVNVKKSEIDEVIIKLKSGVIFGNHNYSFIYRKGSEKERALYWRIDHTKDEKNKFYSNMKSFASAIIRFSKRGY